MSADHPSQLGKYQLVGVVGQGAMGVVHKAFDPVLNRTLAIKVMSAVIGGDAQLRERFLREARTAGSLQHPNVITVFDFGEMDEHLFIAMEYVEGYDLAEVIAQHLPLALEAKLDILIDTLSGLGYAHSHGVVHRDIKPANIRITVEGRAKLMDFGIAHLQQSDLTRSGEMIGTPQYMAPEQITGDPVTPATDIFSLGSVAYELLAQAKPFEGDTLHAMLFDIVSADARPPTTIVPSLPPALDEVLAKAMAKDPTQRYESAAAMAKALMKVRQTLAPSAMDATALVMREAMRATVIPKTLPPGPRRRVSVRTRALQVAGVSLGAVAIFMVARLTGSRSVAVPASTAEVATAAHAVQPAAAPVPAPVPASVPAQATARQVTASIPPAAPANAARDTIVRSVRTAALLSRRRAVDAGATSGELANGDLELAFADDLAGQSRPSESIDRLSAAAQMWSVAERAARERTAAAALAAERARIQLASAPLPASPTTPVMDPPTAATATAPSIRSAPPSAAETRAAIERVIVAYEEAIESSDIARIRLAYPGLSVAQQANWEGFFRSARAFRATLGIARFDVTGASAAVGLDALYEYENRTSGRGERHALQLQATLARDADGAWRLVTIR